MIINIQDDILKIQVLGLLDRLLVDKTTKRNIMWATDAHSALGIKYERNEEITSELITGSNAGIIKTRARKAMEAFVKTVQENVQKTIEDKSKELLEQLERHKAEQEKNTVEEEVQAHLRGFSRTIPSFIMAYGDGKLTLANFDDYTDKTFADLYMKSGLYITEIVKRLYRSKEGGVEEVGGRVFWGIRQEAW